MASTNAPAADKAQRKQTKQSARRIVPVIPRQFARPKKQTAELKEIKEAVIKQPEEKVLSPKIEPVVAEAVVEKETPTTQQSPSEQVEKVEEKAEPVNGHAAAVEPVTVVGQEQSLSSETSGKQIEVEPAAPDQPKPGQTKQEQKSEEEKHPSAPSKPFKPARAPLPPPFVPSRQLHRYPSPSTSATHSSATFPVAPHHAAQPSIEGLMFGGYRDSTNISPVSVQMSASPHPQPFVNGTSVSLQSTHMPHYSGDIYPPQQPFNTTTTASQRDLDFVPSLSAQPATLPLAHVNGVSYMSRTPSQASFDASLGHQSNSGIITPEFIAHAHHREPTFDSRQIAAHAQQMPHSGAPTPAIQQPLMQSDIANMQAMRHYLLDRFGNYDFADYVLDLAINRSLPVHSLLLARSPGMRAILHRARKDEGSPYWRLRISPDDYYREPDAFVDAVKYLYGGDLLDASQLLQALPVPEAGTMKAEHELKARMTYVLSYVAAGLTLDIPEIHVHGVQIADRLLRWENIEPVLELSLNSHFQQTMAVQHILRTAVDFITLSFPVHFALDTTAPQLPSLPRLIEQQQQTESESTPFPQGRRQSHHRLKSIRFGDAPVGQEIPFQASILSSVLTSLPFEILTNIFQSLALRDRLGSVLVTQHMYAVVGEREKRRTGAMRVYGHSPHAQNVDPVIIQNLGWEESVEPSDEEAVGLRIVRRRVEDAVVNGHGRR